MYLGDHARNTPEKPALVSVATGDVLTYGQLNDRSIQLARHLHSLGLRRGDHVALMCENRMCFPEIVWAALRSGLYFTPINRYFTADEAAYIINNSGARAVLVSDQYRDIAQKIAPQIPACTERILIGDGLPGWSSYDAVLAQQDTEPMPVQWMGETMLYSSGTTGRPSGIKRRLQDATIENAGFALGERMSWFGFSESTVYLSTAPLYHAAPLSYSIGTQYLGGTVVMMERFDAETALATIEKHRVTHSQWVPTMFVRMLKLPQSTRRKYDLSSMTTAIHAAAPCPPEVKRAMIDWWGERVHEYYGATERIGTTYISAAEWLAKPGSVGKPRLGVPHVCDEDGYEVSAGTIGQIYFELQGEGFEYHNNPEKSAKVRHPRYSNWVTVGDLGYLDADGYLFLTDRKAFTIVSGGVNIYPQAIEDALALHPLVSDAAVFGIPNEEFGEEVKAVIELMPGTAPSDAVRESLLDFLRERIAAYMVPRSIDFIDQLPRLPTGKLYKQKLKDTYWT
jgi:long-chain acyl-CoA synthetase